MYARITPYRLKPGSIDEAKRVTESLKDRIMALPGQKSFLNALNDGDGTGYVISTTEFAEPTPEAAKEIKALWANFSKLLEGEPSASTYSVMCDWR